MFQQFLRLARKLTTVQCGDWSAFLLFIDAISLGFKLGTLPKTNIALENRPSQKDRIASQPSIFRCKLAVSLREGSIAGTHPGRQNDQCDFQGPSRTWDPLMVSGTLIPLPFSNGALKIWVPWYGSRLA